MAIPDKSVAFGILERDGKILIGLRPATAALPNRWEFPGGKVERGELSHETVIREWREELACQVVQLFYLGRKYEDETGYTFIAFAVRIRPLDLPLARWHDELAWVELDRISEYDMPPIDQWAIEEYRRTKEARGGDSSNSA